MKVAAAVAAAAAAVAVAAVAAVAAAAAAAILQLSSPPTHARSRAGSVQCAVHVC